MDSIFEAPQSITHLLPHSLSLSAKQRQVLETLSQHPQGAPSSKISRALGVHINTVRGHLDELVDYGLVRISSAPAQGRGRPTLIFHLRTPDFPLSPKNIYL